MKYFAGFLAGVWFTLLLVGTWNRFNDSIYLALIPLAILTIGAFICSDENI